MSSPRICSDAWRSAIACRRNAFRRQSARVVFRPPARQRGEYDANGFARWVGPAERPRGAGVAEGLFRTSGTTSFLTDGETQAARSESLRVVILDHQLGRLGLDGFAARPQKLTQKPREVRRGGVRPSPRSAQLSPVGTVPVPLLRLRIAAPCFGRGTFHLADNHLFQLELSESLSRVFHA